MGKSNLVPLSLSKGDIMYFEYNPFSGELKLNKEKVGKSELENISKKIKGKPEGLDVKLNFDIKRGCKFENVKKISYFNEEEKNLELKAYVK